MSAFFNNKKIMTNTGFESTNSKEYHRTQSLSSLFNLYIDNEHLEILKKKKSKLGFKKLKINNIDYPKTYNPLVEKQENKLPYINMVGFENTKNESKSQISSQMLFSPKLRSNTLGNEYESTST